MKFFVLLQPFFDSVVRIQNVGDRGIMVHGIDQKSNVF